MFITRTVFERDWEPNIVDLVLKYADQHDNLKLHLIMLGYSVGPKSSTTNYILYNIRRKKAIISEHKNNKGYFLIEDTLKTFSYRNLQELLRV